MGDVKDIILKDMGKIDLQTQQMCELCAYF